MPAAPRLAPARTSLAPGRNSVLSAASRMISATCPKLSMTTQHHGDRVVGIEPQIEKELGRAGGRLPIRAQQDGRVRIVDLQADRALQPVATAAGQSQSPRRPHGLSRSHRRHRALCLPAASVERRPTPQMWSMLNPFSSSHSMEFSALLARLRRRGRLVGPTPSKSKSADTSPF